MHAFVDESVRGQRYLVSAALIDPSDLTRLRKELRALLLPGQRELHFQKEKPQRRRRLPLLWISDALGWCYGAGGDWRRRVACAINGVVDCDQL